MEATNEITAAYDGNRIILNDQELRAEFPNAVDYPPDTVGPLGHDIIAKIICNRGVGHIMESGTDENHLVNVRGPITLRYLRFRLTDVDGRVVNLRGTSISFCIYLDDKR